MSQEEKRLECADPEMEEVHSEKRLRPENGTRSESSVRPESHTRPERGGESIDMSADIALAESVLSGAKAIVPPNTRLEQSVLAVWDAVAKPLNGFGDFERLTARIAAVQGQDRPDVRHPAILVLAADNGVVREGVSQSGQEITALCAKNIAAGKSTLGPLAVRAGAKILVVDLGIMGDPVPGVIDERICSGTADFCEKPAMTRAEALAAIGTGIRLVREKKEQGFTLLGTGEMGIGNTTTSAAVLCALLDLPPEKAAGRGAGLTDSGLARKREVIRKGLDYYRKDLSDPLAVLSDLGGLDIAGLVGICLGGAVYHVPVVLDGFISQTAALLAERLVPGVSAFLIPSHLSREGAGEILSDALGLHPVLDAHLAVGEGTGAALMIEMLQAACAVLETSSRFAGYGMAPYQRESSQEVPKGCVLGGTDPDRCTLDQTVPDGSASDSSGLHGCSLDGTGSNGCASNGSTPDRDASARMLLVIGGSGSGKSVFAEQRMLDLSQKNVYYVATMRVRDGEARKKADKHIRRRAGYGWITIEQPENLGAIRLDGKGKPALILEDLPNLLANEMFRDKETIPGETAVQKILKDLAALRGRTSFLTIVTGDVFSDGIEYGPETTDYLHALAELNCGLSGQADQVVEMVCGIAVWQKGGSEARGAGSAKADGLRHTDIPSDSRIVRGEGNAEETRGI